MTQPTPWQLLEQLQQNDITVLLEEGQLQLEADEELLTAELIAQISHHKQVLAAFLRLQDRSPLPRLGQEGSVPLSFAQKDCIFYGAMPPKRCIIICR